eukprot:scaffold659491_cov57-Prasinocladus_malaysianus.AAC.1
MLCKATEVAGFGARLARVFAFVMTVFNAIWAWRKNDYEVLQWGCIPFLKTAIDQQHAVDIL